MKAKSIKFFLFMWKGGRATLRPLARMATITMTDQLHQTVFKAISSYIIIAVQLLSFLVVWLSNSYLVVDHELCAAYLGFYISLKSRAVKHFGFRYMHVPANALRRSCTPSTDIKREFCAEVVSVVQSNSWIHFIAVCRL